MNKKTSTILLVWAIAAMPVVCFASDQTTDGGPLTAGAPASVHEARVLGGVNPAVIAVVAGAVIITIIAANIGSSNGTH